MAWGGNTGLDFIEISDVSDTINSADWSADILNSSKQLALLNQQSIHLQSINVLIAMARN